MTQWLSSDLHKVPAGGNDLPRDIALMKERLSWRLSLHGTGRGGHAPSTVLSIAVISNNPSHQRNFYTQASYVDPRIDQAETSGNKLPANLTLVLPFTVQHFSGQDWAVRDR